MKKNLRNLAVKIKTFNFNCTTMTLDYMLLVKNVHFSILERHLCIQSRNNGRVT